MMSALLAVMTMGSLVYLDMDLKARGFFGPSPRYQKYQASLKIEQPITVHEIDQTNVVDDSHAPHDILESIYDEVMRGVELESFHLTKAPNTFSRSFFIQLALGYKLQNGNQGSREWLRKKLDALYPRIVSQLPYPAQPRFKSAIKASCCASAAIAAGALFWHAGDYFSNRDLPLLCGLGASFSALYTGYQWFSMGRNYGLKRGDQITRDWNLYRHLDYALKESSRRTHVIKGDQLEVSEL